MFHFGWFIGRGYSPHAWNQPWSGSIGSDWMEADLYVDLARAMDRACFDYLMIEDGSFIADAFQGSPEWYLRHAYSVPKSDPVPLVPILGQATSHLGIIATITTAFYPPYLAARLGATLDHLTHGRVGLNLVTAHNDRSAQNYGLDRHYEHDMRYEMADEWMEIANRLWASWEPGAIVRRIPDTPTCLPIPHQNPPDRFRRPFLLQVARTVEHRAGAAAPAGHLPGRRIARRPRLCRQTC